MMGELLTTMVANDAFTQALTNPLLARNVFNEATFSAAGMKIINETSVAAADPRQELHAPREPCSPASSAEPGADAKFAAWVTPRQGERMNGEVRW